MKGGLFLDPISRNRLKNNIRLAMEKQLKAKGVSQYPHYKDLVQDYLNLWDIKNLLADDIKVRGVSIRWENGERQSGYKKNESISELLKVNKQMLTILYDLGIRASDLKVVVEDDNDL